MTHRLILCVVILLFSLGNWSCGSSKPVQKSNQARFEKLKIIHWNDFHAQNIPVSQKKDGQTYRYGGSAVLKGYIDSLKSLSSNSLVLFAGDDFQGTPISSLTKGRSQLILMNEIRPDVVTLGNHEFDYGKENLTALLYGASYDVVCANLIVKKTGESLFPPYKIIERGNLKIAVIGLITVDLPKVSIPENIDGLEAQDYVPVLTKMIPEIKSKHKPDLMIVLSHIGVSDKNKSLYSPMDDFEISRFFPAIDVFVGGHTHTPIFEPIRKGNGIIVQAGSRGRYVGELDLVVDVEGDSIVSFSGKLNETVLGTVTPNARIQALVDSMEVPLNQMMSEKIGVLQSDWKSRFNESSNIATWQTDVMREELKVDIAVQNSGGVRKSLNAGEITIRDMYEISPFGNSFNIFTVTGKELRLMLEWQIEGRGEFCDFSGVVCKYNGNFPFLTRIKELTVNGAPVDNDKTYTVVMNNYAASQLKTMFGLLRDVKIEGTSFVDHDFFIEAVRKRKIISGEPREWLINIAKKK